ncbi:MAG: glycosyltransferase family 4 protein [Deltaproteobacteria bacterium]|nr:glycosyltransferase family 4 protein [Deltaproteobacteria bacterium]
MTRLRIAISAELLPGGIYGGIEQFVISLVKSLGQLNDGSEEYVIIGHYHKAGWLKPFLGLNQKLVKAPPPTRMEPFKRLLGPLRGPVGKVWRYSKRFFCHSQQVNLLSVPESNGFYESLGVDLIHFPHQQFVKCKLPTVYNPHDLQHLHYPQFFRSEDIELRNMIYKTGCAYAYAVIAESQWVKNDIISNYGINPEKVTVIMRGAPTQLYEPVSEKILLKLKKKFKLPETFVLYPAQTWPHKNHIRLLEAISLLHTKEALSIKLVCTGKKNEFWPVIKKRIRELRLEEQVRFLGFVSPVEIRALYRIAQFVIFPSLFEGGGFPVVEAFSEGVPCACSSVTSLPEYGGDAVLYFDPTSVESIAHALYLMSTDSHLRKTLKEKGKERSKLFDWHKTAKTYRALYRKIAGLTLSEEEEQLLAACSSNA